LTLTVSKIFPRTEAKSCKGKGSGFLGCYIWASPAEKKNPTTAHFQPCGISGHSSYKLSNLIVQ